MINPRYLPGYPYDGQVTAIKGTLPRSKTYYAVYDGRTSCWKRLG